jgi:hypothetical protein
MPFLLLLAFFPWWNVDPSLPLGAGGYRVVATGDPRIDLILTVSLGAAVIAAGVLAVRVLWERLSFLKERKA